MNEIIEKSLTKIKSELINEKGACEICHYDFKPILQIHHITPISLGGGNNIDNLIILCPNCHKIIHSLDSDYSTDFFGVDYFDDWMDRNMSREQKQIYFNFAVEILKGRYPHGEFDQ